MKVQVKLTKDSDWQEVDVIGFYDPNKHHTVRLDGNPEKIRYYQMKMQDGRVYDKEEGKWVLTNPDHVDIVVDKVVSKLPYNNGSVKKMVLKDVLPKVNDVVGFIKECYRVLADRGILVTEVYLMPAASAFSDPEYKNYFSVSTFTLFKKGERYDLFSNVSTMVRGDVVHVTLKK